MENNFIEGQNNTEELINSTDQQIQEQNNWEITENPFDNANPVVETPVQTNSFVEYPANEYTEQPYVQNVNTEYEQNFLPEETPEPAQEYVAQEPVAQENYSENNGFIASEENVNYNEWENQGVNTEVVQNFLPEENDAPQTEYVADTPTNQDNYADNNGFISYQENTNYNEWDNQGVNTEVEQNFLPEETPAPAQEYVAQEPVAQENYSENNGFITTSEDTNYNELENQGVNTYVEQNFIPEEEPIQTIEETKVEEAVQEHTQVIQDNIFVSTPEQPVSTPVEKVEEIVSASTPVEEIKPVDVVAIPVSELKPSIPQPEKKEEEIIPPRPKGPSKEDLLQKIESQKNGFELDRLLQKENRVIEEKPIIVTKKEEKKEVKKPVIYDKFGADFNDNLMFDNSFDTDFNKFASFNDF